jgi:hypothetical protein
MPAQYEKIKQSYLARGKSLKTAKRIAAQTFIAYGNEGGSRSVRAKELQADRPVKRSASRSVSR